MRALEREQAPASQIVGTQIQMSQGGVCWEGRGNRRSTSVTNLVVTQIQINQDGLGKVISTNFVK